MPAGDPITRVVREWVEKAENDLSAARLSLQATSRCPTDVVCFHAQQCVEKYLKALLTLRGIPFPRIHDLAELVLLLPASDRPQLVIGEQETLTAYATIARYPGDYEPIPIAKAREAARTARRVRSEVRKLLPKAALRRRTR